MLRTIIENDGKLVQGGYAVAGAYATGMGVTLDDATAKATIPSAETAEGIYVLDKERIPTGRNAALTDYSDYEDEFNTFKAGEQCKAKVFYAGEQFAVDQYDATNCVAANAGKYAAVGADGKWTIAASSTNSKYVFVGLHNDAGHTLALIKVVDTAGANS